MRVSMTWIKAVVLGACAITTGVGCSSAPAEQVGQSSAKLLAPRAVYRLKASSTTRSQIGVAEWRMYMGKRRVVLTGYDASGHAVQGVSVGAAQATKTSRARLVMHTLDGSHASTSYDFYADPVKRGIAATKTKLFLLDAFADLESVQKRSRSGLREGNECLGSVPSTLLDGVSCAGSLAAVPDTLGAATIYVVRNCSGFAVSLYETYQKCSASSPEPPAEEQPPANDPNDPRTRPDWSTAFGPDEGGPPLTPAPPTADSPTPEKAAQAVDDVSQNQSCASCPDPSNPTPTAGKDPNAPPATTDAQEPQPSEGDVTTSEDTGAVAMGTDDQAAEPDATSEVASADPPAEDTSGAAGE